MTVIYELRDLVKEYGGRRVLEIHALDIHQGEIFALVGPSGAGKSTLLRLMNFLEPPTSGRLIFYGREYRRGDEMPLKFRRQVTTVFQQPVLLSRNVRENVTYGLRIRGNKDSNDMTQAVLKEVGLNELSHQPASKLSGGEAQRAALARAMIIRPDVLLLDEPTANLDPYNVSLIEDIVKKINHDEDTTIIMVTHNIYQARRMAERVGLILDGNLIEVCGVEKFFNAPNDQRTAAFIRGDMVY